MFIVKLTYFKQTGKYYSEGNYQTDLVDVFRIFNEAKQMLANGRRPGLVDGSNEFYTLVELPDHPTGYPMLIMPTLRIP